MANRFTPLEKNINLRHNLIFFIVITICILSSLTIFSIARGKITGIFQKHVINIIFSIFLYLLFLKIKIPKKYFFLYYSITLILLFLPLLISPYPKRWVVTHLFSFQPSEIARIPFFISLSILLQEKERIKFKDSLLLFIFCFLPFLLILMEPDLGSSFFYLCVFFVILIFKRSELWLKLFYLSPIFSLIFSFNYVSFIIFLFVLIFVLLYFKIKGILSIYFLSLSILIGLTAPFIWNKALKDYQRKRILIFINPSMDPKGAGWQITQGLIAIGSGKVKGKGFLKGLQKGLAFLPAAHTDFAFASFAEEFGFFGSFFLLFLYFLFFKNLIFLSRYTDSFSFPFSLFTIFSYLYSFSLNLGGELGILPLTGIPLPFFSYGGTSLLTNFLLLSLFRNFQRSLFYKG